MKTLLLCSFAALVTLCTSTAQAHFTFTLAQVGNSVVVTGSGTLNLNGLTPGSTVSGEGNAIIPSGALMSLDPLGASLQYYTGAAGPGSWGSGGYRQATSASGDAVSISGTGTIYVPVNYAFNTPLADTMTFSGQTFATLGFTPGTYTYMWSSDSLMVTSVVPEPSTWTAVLAGAGLLVLTAHQRAAEQSKAAVLLPSNH